MYSIWWLIVCVALLFSTDSPTQLQTVQFPYLDTRKVFKECREVGVDGRVGFSLASVHAWLSYYYVFKTSYHLHYSDYAGS